MVIDMRQDSQMTTRPCFVYLEGLQHLVEQGPVRTFLAPGRQV